MARGAVRPAPRRDRAWSAEDAPREHPILRYYLATGDASAMQVADVPRRFADERVLARWREWCADMHGSAVQSQLALPVHVGPRANRSFLVGRGDPFSDPEMDLGRRLQHVLSGLDRQFSGFARWSDLAGDIGTEVAEAVRLTPREVVVLELLATGLTAGAIARRLAIAERTVQKQLQRVYAKLDVDDRLTAVRRAQRIGLLGGPDEVREIRSSRPVARVLPRRSLDGTPSARTRGARRRGTR